MRRALLVGVLTAIVVLALATGASGSAGEHAANACSKARASTSATVTRVGGTGTFRFGRVDRISSRARARSLADALCGLPRMPVGIFHCPFDAPPSYVVRFATDDRTVARATVDPTGCELVRGLVYIRTVSKDPGFWRVLGASLGLANATVATFRA